ncbi:late control protein B [Obesumbacterium proteus]|uniref:ogr/Delta-like zinc finger family protein n=1 Tax=Obesumbacterium proteus TaxID=82983 RepID=UPI0010345077|nr:ogr/Delta-like zinc finger family protein [Obesumbacterium proteus]TBL75428.1 late control protein B [Obesumbacterium proteus]
MMNCPLCGCAAHTRSSFVVTSETKERYNQCTNINCGHTFITHETFVRSIMIPGKVVEAQAHAKGQQPSLSF